jgi:hypothetical protein
MAQQSGRFSIELQQVETAHYRVATEGRQMKTPKLAVASSESAALAEKAAETTGE